jgi:glucose/arabinose dehydrogenase
VPTDNPFGNEVFIYGLRNPWRWSFDSVTGDMWIGDVGQGVTEELDVLKPSEQKGANLGWSVYEANNCCATQGDHCTQQTPYQPCVSTGMIFPKITQPASGGWHAIIGGQVYRGACFPDLVGTYLYTDNSRGHLLKAQLQTDGTVTSSEVTGTFPNAPASLHADSRGELYLTTSSTPGKVYRIEVTP